MSYQVLARKWRPKNFTEIIGQEHVLRALKNALAQNRLHHAYLFAGTRGVGKTTIARILAKCLNCEIGITTNPCGTCDACLEIDNGRFIDLIEVDAASRTKVEDTRDLLDNVQYLPTKGKYKIYIIDEVHMLSGHSFNALLKTLEEPPAHVKFLLATTEPQKLPITVLSRCLQFNLKALQPELIQKQLQHILTQEEIPYEEAALQQLAFSAQGSVRDALSLLDQAIAFGHHQVVAAEVKAMLGTIDTSKIFALLEGLVANNANKILAVIAELAELATDFISAIDELLEVLHQISLVQLVPNINPHNWRYPALVQQLATTLDPEETQLYYQIALMSKRDLLLAPNPQAGFEMMLLRMLAFRPETTAPAGTVTNQPNLAQPPVEQPTPPDLLTPELISKLELTGATQALLQHCIVSAHANNNIELLLDPSQAPLLNKKHEERISKALSKYYAAPIAIKITLGTPNMNTPTKLKQQAELHKQNQALRAIEKDHKIQEFISKFDAKIIANSATNENN